MVDMIRPDFRLSLFLNLFSPIKKSNWYVIQIKNCQVHRYQGKLFKKFK